MYSQKKVSGLFVFLAGMLALPTSAANISKTDCKGVAQTALTVINDIGAEKLTKDFVGSFSAWLGPTFECNGPKKIVIGSKQDAAAYLSIRGLLLASKRPISLNREDTLKTKGTVTSDFLEVEIRDQR